LILPFLDGCVIFNPAFFVTVEGKSYDLDADRNTYSLLLYQLDYGYSVGTSPLISPGSDVTNRATLFTTITRLNVLPPVLLPPPLALLQVRSGFLGGSTVDIADT